MLENADLRGANLAGADLEGVVLNGAKLGRVTVGQMSSAGPTTHTTDLRGVVGLTPEVLTSTEGWEDSYRDQHLACGKPIPQESNRVGDLKTIKRRTKAGGNRKKT